MSEICKTCNGDGHIVEYSNVIGNLCPDCSGSGRGSDTALTRIRELEQALLKVTELYCDLANSGDAGFWDPEKVDEIKHARAALSSKDQEKTNG